MKNKEPTKPPTPEEIAIQLKEFGETLGFPVEKKCNNCKLCKCKTTKYND